MINKNELTEEEQNALKIIALERKKKQLEDELEEIKLKQKGFKNGKKSVEQIKNYFKGN